MSSLPEKSQPLTTVTEAATSTIVATKPKRPSTTFFFRSDSIQKIKCTAVYPFQVAGLKLSKNVIIELLETNIMKARICTQKTMLNFYYVILKLLSTLFTLWDNKVAVTASNQQITVDSESSSTGKTNDSETQTTEKQSITSFQSRLQEKLAKIQLHKSRLDGSRLIPSTSSASSISSKPSAPATTNDLTCLRGSQVSTAIEKLKSFNVRQSSKLLNKSKMQKFILALGVNAGLVVMYLQIVILIIALNTVSIPIGLVFMIVNLGTIGYLLLKLSIMDTTSTTGKSSPLPKVKNSRRSPDLIKDDFSPERHSRSKAKKPYLDIELKYKALSKVKLL